MIIEYERIRLLLDYESDEDGTYVTEVYLASEPTTDISALIRPATMRELDKLLAVKLAEQAAADEEDYAVEAFERSQPL